MSFQSLSEAEQGGLRASLPSLWEAAEEMNVLAKPLADWRKEEVLGFLAIAVTATAKREKQYLTKDLDDDIPFGGPA